MATMFPIWVVSATAFWEEFSMAALVYSVQLRVMGTLMETRSGARNCLNVSKLVVLDCISLFSVKLKGSTRMELKCNTSNRVPSLMNPLRGEAHPSPMTWSQFRSKSVINTLGSPSASSFLAAFKCCGTCKSITSSPSGFGNPGGVNLGAPSNIPSISNLRNKISADSSIANSCVLNTISGLAGGSYGSSIHVKCFSSPLSTRAYCPLGSLFFNSSTGTSKKIS
mmetsp:Transcript_30218/g.54723  ORF Transcript_30218/g.54723 Transcript_30218/m.54723 type:complete len:224 (-) Transcript_30218:931-1602(-)